ncbi:peptidoglycan DD-metalloendopeptidase family protein [Propioniciclava soli]|uniref:Peptidoglycan DD-metalloendopeptidase family protein n=1 Tax=Propioniciclava soli TaxID=2775081 RepID=A0ABZ3CAT0_9ACTN
MTRRNRGWARRAAAWCVVTLLVALPVVGAAAPLAAAASLGQLPVPGAVVTGFDPPEVRWGAGHRGVDLAGTPGETVVSPAAGTVTFAGEVAGRHVVVVTHDDRRSTLEPVTASVAVGTRVAAGDPVGVLDAGHACPAVACLHWGLKRAEEYLDPLMLLDGSTVRLLPADAAAGVRARAAAREAAAFAAAVASGLGPAGGAAASGAAPPGSGVLALPTAGRLGSVFGPRFHPIFHEWRMHNGIDLSAGCGTPLLAAADGVVSHVGFDASGGWRLVIAHGQLGGVDLQTVYLHAQGYRVRVGERVTRGQFVGTMGSTGWSTGCHLHFSVKVNGRHTDPQRWLG